MPDSGFLALFLVGLLGGTHCVGMCGGIVSAMSMGGGAGWGMHLAYNSGRILSYAAAGAIAGALGAASMGPGGQLPFYGQNESPRPPLGAAQSPARR